MEENKTTALAIPIENFRHPLMKETLDKDYVKKSQEELELDTKLGLKNQFNKTAENLLSSDIDELTNSRDYYEVDKFTISRLFEIGSLKNRCILYNIKEAVSKTFKSIWPVLLCGFAAISLTIGGIFSANMATTNSSYFFGIISTLCFVGTIGAIIGGIAFLQNTSFEYTFADVGLEVEALQDTDIKLPYGAKLKTLEAKETNIFEGFAIVYPKFKVVNKKFDKPFKIPDFRNSLDPAIVGLTRDNRMFMICYWDIEADKEKVIKDIDKFKKFKLSK